MSRERRFRNPLHRLTAMAALLLAAAAFLWAPVRPAWGDDRDLLRETSGDPYAFILFDTSGSMNQVFDSAAEILAAADSPQSKMYKAKEALYGVVEEFDNIHFGFATYNQDDVRVYRKHWIYQPQTDPSWKPTLLYPLASEGYSFGGGEPAVNALNTAIQYTCGSPKTISTTTPGNLELSVFPRGGDTGTVLHGAWLKQTRTYYVETRILTGSLGDATITVQLTRKRLSTGSNRCGNNPPYNSSFDETLGPITITYTLVTDSLVWTQDTSPGFNDKTAGNTCAGLDPNTDTSSDDYFIGLPINRTVNLKYPTITSAVSPLLDSGDMLPLNWSSTNKLEVMQRLAPNLRLGETVPDFRIARYFRDTPTGTISTGRYALELKNSSVRPLVAEGSTPIGNSMEGFRRWFSGCARGTCGANAGWRGLAAVEDPSWPCKKKYLIVLTDGDETCSNASGAVTAATRLNEEGITTFVIALGLPGHSQVLDDMAANGGSNAPVYVDNPAALAEALGDIFLQILEQSRAFASAAVPGVQAEVQDKIYLTNFTPLNTSAYWDGHVDAYLKPLPRTTEGLPDKSRVCTSGETSGCRVWDAGEKILDLAPSASDLALANFHIGESENERRVFYTQAQLPTDDSVPAKRLLLEPESVTSYDDRLDLWTGLDLFATPAAIPGPTNTSGIAAANAEVVRILKSTYKTKSATIPDPFGGAPLSITYLLGDIFHSNPILLGTPGRTRYFADDLHSQNKKCSEGDPGYRCFAKKHERRRKMLIVGANDQQIHIFDAGIFRGNLETGLFDEGTGYEIYSYVPRPVLPNLNELSEPSADQDWGVDGTIQFDDVYIDPRHNGTPAASGREWRTIVVGGLREGGSGYFALDLTQPDKLNSDNVPQPKANAWVPSCWNQGADNDAECGTVPFGSVLWSFTDVSDEDAAEVEPDNGVDLGDTWSTPNTGRIRVKVSTGPDVFEDRYVAVFGGGMDPSRENKKGNWLYMVDIETGKILYKRKLEGSAPSDPAAVDTDQDGYLDTVYIGTTLGFLYKADLRTTPLLELHVPSDEKRILDSAWEPFKIFDTIQTTGPTIGRRGPIFFAPSVIFVTRLGRYALAFGTGNREDLWSNDGTPGRFYVILDEAFAAGMTPRTEASYSNITNTIEAPDGVDYLLNPPNGPNSPRGWFLELDADERIITKAFALSGILIFTAYDPETLSEEPGICARAGESSIFTVFTSTGDGVGNPTTIEDPDNPGETITVLSKERFRRVADFVTNPFVESSATKNKPRDGNGSGGTGGTGGSGGTGGGGEEPDAPPICQGKELVTQRLMALFPTNCQFANHTQNIETIQSDNGLVCIAPVPVCVVRKNWKEN